MARNRVLDRLLFGRPSVWSPRRLPALGLWLDADDGGSMILSGSKITQWNDKSGNGKHVVQASDAARPVFTAGGLNGRSVATFSGAQYLSGSGYSHGQELSVAAVGLAGVAAQAFYSMGNQGTSETLRISGSSVLNFKAADSATAATSSYLTYDAHVLTGVADASSSDMWSNGSIGVAGAGGASVSNMDFLIGALTTSSYFLVGYIAELLFFTGALSTSERQALEGYLAWKWGLQSTLPSSHPYKGKAP